MILRGFLQIVFDTFEMHKRPAMPYYRIIFAKNQIISCIQTEEGYLHTNTPFYEHNKGQMIFAVIEAANIDEACATARDIVKQLSPDIPGENRRV